MLAALIAYRADNLPLYLCAEKVGVGYVTTVMPNFPTRRKKYDLKSKHCGAQTDLGTTRAKVVEALTEVRRAKIDGPALIFDDQLCELHSRTPTPAHQRRAGQCQMSSEGQ